MNIMNMSERDMPIRMLLVGLRIDFCKKIEMTRMFRIMPKIASGKLTKPCVCVEYSLLTTLGILKHSIVTALSGFVCVFCASILVYEMKALVKINNIMYGI